MICDGVLNNSWVSATAKKKRGKDFLVKQAVRLQSEEQPTYREPIGYLRRKQRKDRKRMGLQKDNERIANG